MGLAWTELQDDTLSRLAHLPDGVLAPILSAVGPERTDIAVAARRQRLSLPAPPPRAWPSQTSPQTRPAGHGGALSREGWPVARGDRWFVRRLLEAQLRLVRATA